MHEVTVLSAVLAGTILGKLYDPLAWVLIAVAFSFGAQRFKWWLMPVVAAAFTGINVALVYSRLAELGIAYNWKPKAILIFSALLAISCVAYGAGRILAWIGFKKQDDPLLCGNNSPEVWRP